MKVDALVKSLEAIAGSAANSTLAVGDFSTAARAFGGAKTTRAFLASVEAAAKDPSPDSFGSSLGSLVDIVETLSAISEAIGSKAVRDEITELRRLVITYPNVRLRGLRLPMPAKSTAKKPTDPLRFELVTHYRNEIEALRLGSPELTTLFERLASDKKMRGLEMASLASSVAYETSASTRKSESLRRIRQRHESYLTSAAKSDALKGSSAT